MKSVDQIYMVEYNKESEWTFQHANMDESHNNNDEQ